MTTSLDARLVPAAKRLLTKFGKTVTITRVTDNSFDPNSLEHLPTGIETQTVKVTPPQALKTKFINGELIKHVEGRTYLSPTGLEFVPVQGNTITIDSNTISIVYVVPHYSGDDIVLYELGLESL